MDVVLGPSGRLREVAVVDIARIAGLVEDEARALGFDLVRVRWFANGLDGDEPTLQIMAERPETGQLGIEDCADLSRRISDRFDALEEAGDDPVNAAYRLEVSSPGIDRPLTRAKDWANWAGHDAKVTLAQAEAGGRKHLVGRITALAGDEVQFVDRKGGALMFPLADVAEAKLLLTDALIAAAAPLSADGADEFVDSADGADEWEEED